MSTRMLLYGAVTATLAGSAIPGSAEGQARQFPFQYVAKVVCGAPREPVGVGAVPQVYVTSVNIHNPTDSVAFFMKSLVVTTPPGGQSPVRALRISNDSLGIAMALATDCADLRRRRPQLPAFFEGFVILDSRVSLNVVSVYTVTGGIDVVHVPERSRAPR
jgi:hypothetical protein